MDGVQDGIENAINAYCLRKLRDRAKRCVKVPHLKDGLGPRPVCRFHRPKLCNFQPALTRGQESAPIDASVLQAFLSSPLATRLMGG